MKTKRTSIGSLVFFLVVLIFVGCASDRQTVEHRGIYRRFGHHDQGQVATGRGRFSQIIPDQRRDLQECRSTERVCQYAGCRGQGRSKSHAASKGFNPSITI